MSACMSCVACQKCNTCQLACESCQNSCDTRQNYCSNNHQLVSSFGNFSFDQELSSNKLFLSADNWNKIITYIYNAYKKGIYLPQATNGNWQYADTIINSWKVKRNDIMTAELFNNVALAMQRLGSTPAINLDNNGKSKVYGVNSVENPAGDIIYGTYFEKLEEYARLYFNFDFNQCSLCNVACDNGCNTCEGCNACENCNVGNASPCCSACNFHIATG